MAALATQLTGEVLLEAGIPFVDVTSVETLRWRQPTFVDDNIFVTINLGNESKGSSIPQCDSLEVDVSVLAENKGVVAKLSCNVAIDRPVA